MMCILIDTCEATFEQTYAHLKRHFDTVHVISDRGLHCESLVAPTSEARRLCKQTVLWDHLVGAVLPGVDADHVWIVQPSQELPDFSRYDSIDCDLLCKPEVRDRGWYGWKVCRSIYGGKTRRYPNRPTMFPTMSTVAFRMSRRLAARCCEQYARGHTAHRDVFFSSVARKYVLGTQEIELSNIPAAPCIDIVVSCYNTPIDWLNGLVEVLHVHNINRIYIYEKGTSYSDCAALATLDAGKVSFVRLPNVGRCDHTYLYHITHNWHSLGGYTFFLKDTTFDCGWRKRGGVRKRDLSSSLMKFAKTFRADHTFYCATKPMSNAVKLENYQSVRYTSPFHTYDGDMKQYLASLGVSLPDRYTAVLGGVFGAPRANVRKTDFTTYKNIMDTFEHDNCEIGHYVERMWHYMFEVGIWRDVPCEKKTRHDMTSYQKCTIFAKGPTFFNIPRSSQSELRVCVNQTALFVDDVDLIVCNDVESITDILEKKHLTKERLCVPFYPHVKCKPGPHLSTYDFYDRYSSKVYCYNLPTTQASNNGIVLNTAISSTHTAMELILLNYPNITSISTWGFGIGDGYHPVFSKHNRSTRKRKPGHRHGDSIASLQAMIPAGVDFYPN